MANANDYQVGGSHYKVNPIQHWDYVIANDIPYLEAQVIKYVTRWRLKNGIQDLHKAQHYLHKLIESEAQKQEANTIAKANEERRNATVGVGGPFRDPYPKTDTDKFVGWGEATASPGQPDPLYR